MTAAIGLICKAPVPGRTKTRLAASIGAYTAADLSACFIRDLAATIAGIPESVGRRGYAVYAPPEGEPILRELLPPGFRFLLQAGRDLGEVLLGATQALLGAGHDSVLLVNGDSPTLPSRLLLQAIHNLRAPGKRIVLGPASDGGYYLIGLKHPHERLFAEISWGTASVFADTCARAEEIGLPVTPLPEWYDVDDKETLRWLREELEGRSDRFVDGGRAPFTAAYLAAMLDFGR
jgi:rSAM/selenodomain-associated transferase 1